MDVREIYRRYPGEYEALVRAEDCDGNLGAALSDAASIRGSDVVEVGAGTGRVTRLLLTLGARRVVATEREAAMLRLARQTVGTTDGRAVFRLADAARLPLPGGAADAGVAGWVFGHTRYWEPATWRGAVGGMLTELERVVRPGGALVVVETLGTGAEQPGPPSEWLAEYYDWLETERGFRRRPVRTDFRFSSVEDAARTLGFFFGEGLAERVRRNGWTRVPEWTGVWSRVAGLPALKM